MTEEQKGEANSAKGIIDELQNKAKSYGKAVSASKDATAIAYGAHAVKTSWGGFETDEDGNLKLDDNAAARTDGISAGAMQYTAGHLAPGESDDVYANLKGVYDRHPDRMASIVLGDLMGEGAAGNLLAAMQQGYVPVADIVGTIAKGNEARAKAWAQKFQTETLTEENLEVLVEQTRNDLTARGYTVNHVTPDLAVQYQSIMAGGDPMAEILGEYEKAGLISGGKKGESH